MSDNTTADIIVTAQASLTTVENKFSTLARDAASITPTTLTAMDGINQDLALRRHPHVTTVIEWFTGAQSSNSSVDYYHPNSTITSAMNGTGANISTQSNKQLVSNTQFGAMFSQATNHVESAQQLRLKTDFIANTSFPDYGSGITSMSDTLDQGMTSSFGDLNASAKAMSATKGVFDPSDMKTFGTYEGLYKSMNKNKLANFSGLNENIDKYNIDTSKLNDPAYQEQAFAAFSSIKDPATLQTMADQFDLPTNTVTAQPPHQFNPFEGMQGYTGSDASVNQTPGFLSPSTSVPNIPSSSSAFGAPSSGTTTTTGTSQQGGSFGSNQIQGQTGTGLEGLNQTLSGNIDLSGLAGDQAQLNNFLGSNSPALPISGSGVGGIESAADFLSMNKVVGSQGVDLTGMKDGLQFSDIGQKLSGMGASFEDPDTAARMFESIGLPPPDEMELYDGPTSPGVSMGGLQINTMTGQGTGLAGLPNTRDFFPACSGTSEFTTVYNKIDAGNFEDVTADEVQTIQDLYDNAQSLMLNAGIDLDNPPAKNLGHTMTFGTNLHRYGADDLNNPANTTAFGASQAPGEPRGGYAGLAGIDDFGKSVTDMVNPDLLSGFMGTGDVLRDMANTSNKYGQSITASLAEGKNKAVMQANGILPLNYGPNIG